MSGRRGDQSATCSQDHSEPNSRGRQQQNAPIVFLRIQAVSSRRNNPVVSLAKVIKVIVYGNARESPNGRRCRWTVFGQRFKM